MPRELVDGAIRRSEGRKPVVRAMVLLHAARVLAELDHEAARKAFAEGLALVEALPVQGPPGHGHAWLLEEAVRLGSQADPAAAAALFRRLPVHEFGPGRRSTGTMLVQALAQSGDLEAAVTLLEDVNCELGGAQVVMDQAVDPQMQRRILYAARLRWRVERQRQDRRSPPFVASEYYRLFSGHYAKLDGGEARDWLGEILEAVASDPDQPCRSKLGDRVEFRKQRDMDVFWVLNAARSLLTAERVEALLQNCPEVRRAAEVYPLGMDSLMAELRSPPSGERTGRRGGFTYSGTDLRSIRSMMAASQGDPSAIDQLMSEAHHLYARDTSGQPNEAARVFWPSCGAYRTALYWAGKTLGREAEERLAEIPDADMALLATMDLAAGLLGISQYFGIQIGRG